MPRATKRSLIPAAVKKHQDAAQEVQLQSSLVEWAKLQHGGVRESERVQDQGNLAVLGLHAFDGEEGQLNLKVEVLEGHVDRLRVVSCSWPGLNDATRKLLKTELRDHKVGEAPPILRVEVATDLGSAWFESSPGANAQVPLSGLEAQVLAACARNGAFNSTAPDLHGDAVVGAHIITAKLYGLTYGELPLH